MIKNRKAVIFGISSYKLKKSEKIFLRKNKPWGIILFSRNIKDIVQLKKLVMDINSSICRELISLLCSMKNFI